MELLPYKSYCPQHGEITLPNVMLVLTSGFQLPMDVDAKRHHVQVRSWICTMQQGGSKDSGLSLLQPEKHQVKRQVHETSQGISFNYL